ncbi:MAG: 50S ribosomal protein L18 [Candidatus Woesearchaeota archaeon]
MATQKRFTVGFRRKRNGLTNYRKRLRLLISKKHRMVVRVGNKSIITQIIDYSEKGDKVICSAYSTELKKIGWKFNTSNIPSSYLTGFLLGKKALSQNIKEAILDIGLNPPKKGSKIFACLKGAVDAGLSIRYSEDIVPNEKRIKGEHIADYAKKLKENKEIYEKRYSGIIKAGSDPTEISKNYDEVKSNITNG